VKGLKKPMKRKIKFKKQHFPRDGRGMQRAWDRLEMCTSFWSENLKGRERPLGRSERRWEDNSRMGFKEIGIGG
jgi:hypothetical protein